jgi:hypothetical protein
MNQKHNEETWEKRWICRGSNPKPAACKASALPLIYNEITSYYLSPKGRDDNFPFRVERCHIAFKFNRVFRGNNASAKILTKDIFIFWDIYTYTRSFIYGLNTSCKTRVNVLNYFLCLKYVSINNTYKCFSVHSGPTHNEVI